MTKPSYGRLDAKLQRGRVFWIEDNDAVIYRREGRDVLYFYPENTREIYRANLRVLHPHIPKLGRVFSIGRARKLAYPV